MNGISALPYVSGPRELAHPFHRVRKAEVCDAEEGPHLTTLAL